MKFKRTENAKGLIFSATFIDHVKGLINSKNTIHHSHISGEIIGYAHSYCNLKVRENRDKISAIAHNLFRLDFFFFLKGMMAGPWRTRDISVGGKNFTDINFANIGDQVGFIDIIKDSKHNDR